VLCVIVGPIWYGHGWVSPVPVWSVSQSFESGVANVEATPRCNIDIHYIYAIYSETKLSPCSSTIDGAQTPPRRKK
jgi:hypothetical protein